VCRPTKSPLTAAEGLAAGAVVTEDAPLVVVRGDAAGDVEGLPIPGLALGLPLVDGEPEPPVAPPAPVESAEPSVAPAPVAPAAPAVPAAPVPPAAPPPPPAVPEALAPEPPPDAPAPEPPPEALAPELLPPPEPLPPASAIPTASGPIASAIASSRENIVIIIFIEILLRDYALTLVNYGGMMGATDMPLEGRRSAGMRREPSCGPLVGVA
jgi:hypothetical protein